MPALKFKGRQSGGKNFLFAPQGQTVFAAPFFEIAQSPRKVNSPLINSISNPKRMPDKMTGACLKSKTESAADNTHIVGTPMPPTRRRVRIPKANNPSNGP